MGGSSTSGNENHTNNDILSSHLRNSAAEDDDLGWAMQHDEENDQDDRVEDDPNTQAVAPTCKPSDSKLGWFQYLNYLGDTCMPACKPLFSNPGFKQWFVRALGRDRAAVDVDNETSALIQPAVPGAKPLKCPGRKDVPHKCRMGSSACYCRMCKKQSSLGNSAPAKIFRALGKLQEQKQRARNSQRHKGSGEKIQGSPVWMCSFSTYGPLRGFTCETGFGASARFWEDRKKIAKQNGGDKSQRICKGFLIKTLTTTCLRDAGNGQSKGLDSGL